jgi:nucleotide-binding universal stress UspA family protein
MKNLQRILVPTDFSDDSRRAIEMAVLLASGAEASVELLHVRALHTDDPYRPEHHFPRPDELAQILASQDEASLSALETPSSVPFKRTTVRASHVAPAILEHAEKTEADLIVLGTHGRTGLAHAVMGSVAEAVVRGASRPVVTVPGRKMNPAETLVLTDLLVPLDLSDLSASVLEEAVALARRHGSRLHLLHVIEEVPHPAFYLSGARSILEVFPGLEDRVRKKLEDLAAEIATDLPCQCIVAEGRTHRKIVEMASELACGLIVLGSPIRSGIDRLLIGSVTGKVLRMAPKPVLAVRRTGAAGS